MVMKLGCTFTDPDGNEIEITGNYVE